MRRDSCMAPYRTFELLSSLRITETFYPTLVICGSSSNTKPFNSCWLISVEVAEGNTRFQLAHRSFANH